MADRFGFNISSKQFKLAERNFISNGIKLAQLEMKENFEGETNSESGNAWNDISYRDFPPPILDLTGELKNEAIGNKPIIVGNSGTLTIDPIDERGKGYASYHQDGVNQYRSKDEFHREFVTQSEELTNKQTNLLLNEFNLIF